MSKKYALVIGEIVDGVAIADAPLDLGPEYLWIDLTDVNPEPGRDWLYKNSVFSPPPPPPTLPNIISKVAMRFRFTDAEYVAVLNAAKTDTEVQMWYDTFNMVSSFDLKNQRTIDGINNLVSKDLLTQARADEILTLPAQLDES